MANKKKYHQSFKDRMHEHEGMERKKSKKYGMLQEDKSKPSNLPTEVMMHQYPDRDALNTYIDDTMYGIDGQHEATVGGLKKQKLSRMF